MKRRAKARPNSAAPAGAQDWLTPGGKIALIVLPIFLLYLPAFRGEFIGDDQLLVSMNTVLRWEPGHTWQGLAEALRGDKAADYYPLTTILYWIEFRLFGLQTLGYHIVNLALHATASVLVWRVLLRLKIPGAWFVGFVFGIHPVHVESVAWIAEMKNPLAMIFYLLAIQQFWNFEDSVEGRKRWSFIASLLLFACAVLSKAHVVVLPLVLLLCGWWRHGFRGWFADAIEGEAERRLVRRTSVCLAALALAGSVAACSYFAKPEAPELRLLLPFVIGAAFANCVAAALAVKFMGRANRLLTRTIPFFQLAAIFGVVEVCFQYARGIGGENLSMGDAARRIANGGMAAWWYLGKALLPARLNSVYGGWRFDPPGMIELIPAALVLVAGALIWRYRKTFGGGLFFAAAYFVVALLPVLGFFKMGLVWQNTFVTDHFQYFSDISAIALVCAAGVWVSRRFRVAGKSVLWTAAVLCASAMAGYTWDRASIYKNEDALWRDVLSKNPDAWQAHQRIGESFLREGNFREASAHLARAAELKSNNPDIHNLLGLTYCREERFEEGIAEYRRAVETTLNRKSYRRGPLTTIHTNLGNALGMVASRTGAVARYEDAIAEFREALKLEPDNPAVHRNLALMLAQTGAYDEALLHLQRTLELVPDEPLATEMLQALRAR